MKPKIHAPDRCLDWDSTEPLADWAETLRHKVCLSQHEWLTLFQEFVRIGFWTPEHAAFRWLVSITRECDEAKRHEDAFRFTPTPQRET